MKRGRRIEEYYLSVKETEGGDMQTTDEKNELEDEMTEGKEEVRRNGKSMK